MTLLVPASLLSVAVLAAATLYVHRSYSSRLSLALVMAGISSCTWSMGLALEEISKAPEAVKAWSVVAGSGGLLVGYSIGLVGFYFGRRSVRKGPVLPATVLVLLLAPVMAYFGKDGLTGGETIVHVVHGLVFGAFSGTGIVLLFWKAVRSPSRVAALQARTLAIGFLGAAVLAGAGAFVIHTKTWLALSASAPIVFLIPILIASRRILAPSVPLRSDEYEVEIYRLEDDGLLTGAAGRPEADHRFRIPLPPAGKVIFTDDLDGAASAHYAALHEGLVSNYADACCLLETASGQLLIVVRSAPVLSRSMAWSLMSKAAGSFVRGSGGEA